MAVGRVRRAHGVRGAFAVEVLTDAPDVILTSGAVIYAGDRNGAPAAEGALHIDNEKCSVWIHESRTGQPALAGASAGDTDGGATGGSCE